MVTLIVKYLTGRKKSINWGTENNDRNYPKIKQLRVYYDAVIVPNDADGTAKSVDPNQTAPFGAV